MYESKKMNLTNYYWYFQSAVPSRICDEIVKYGKSLSDQMALTGGLGADPKKLNKKQVADLKQKEILTLLMNDRWIYKKYSHTCINKCKCWLKFSWDFSESCQFTKYEKGQYYDWHCDS